MESKNYLSPRFVLHGKIIPNNSIVFHVTIKHIIGYQERLNEYLSFVRGHIVHIAISSYIIPDSVHGIKIAHKFQGSSRTCIRATEAKPRPKLNSKIHLEKEKNYFEAKNKLSIPSNGFNESFEDDSFNM